MSPTFREGCLEQVDAAHLAGEGRQGQPQSGLLATQFSTDAALCQRLRDLQTRRASLLGAQSGKILSFFEPRFPRTHGRILVRLCLRNILIFTAKPQKNAMRPQDADPIQCVAKAGPASALCQHL